MTNEDITHALWAFTGGAILVLGQSILNGFKRRWASLLVGCLFGGFGSVIAGHIWSDSRYLLIICGVAAVVTENILAGALSASQEFASSPIKTITHFAKAFLPTFGKSVGDTNVDDGLK